MVVARLPRSWANTAITWSAANGGRPACSNPSRARPRRRRNGGRWRSRVARPAIARHHLRAVHGGRSRRRPSPPTRTTRVPASPSRPDTPSSSGNAVTRSGRRTMRSVRGQPTSSPAAEPGRRSRSPKQGFRRVDHQHEPGSHRRPASGSAWSGGAVTGPGVDDAALNARDGRGILIYTTATQVRARFQ